MDPILANNIKQFRKKTGLNQEEIANYLGINRVEMNYYENANRDIPNELIPKLADLFGVDEYDLYEEDSSITQTNMAFAFRANSLCADDLKNIAAFKKIALNYLKIRKAIKSNEL